MFADDNSNVIKNLTFVFERVENIVGIEKMHFLLFTQSFDKFSFSGSLPSPIPQSVALGLENRPGGRWFDPQLGQYSFRGLMIVIVTGFIPLSALSIVLTVVMWESSQRLEQNIVWSTG